jgi:hypothetical protein
MGDSVEWRLAAGIHSKDVETIEYFLTGGLLVALARRVEAMPRQVQI